MALRASAAVALIGKGRNPRIVSLYPHLRPKFPAFSSTCLHGRISLSPHLKQGNGGNQSFRNFDIRRTRALNTESTVGTKDLMKENTPQLSQNWKVKMLYDGDCPLCMREVNMLSERNKVYGTIKFVDISKDDYSPQENQDIDYPTAMGKIHAILSDGTIVTNVEAFRRLYEAVGLGWIYAVTKYKPMENILNAVYAVWAKYRMQITGRPPLEDVLETRRKKMGEVCKDSNSCKIDKRGEVTALDKIAWASRGMS